MKIKFLLGIFAALFLFSPVMAEELESVETPTENIDESVKEIAEATVTAREAAKASSRKTSNSARVSIAGMKPIRSAKEIETIIPTVVIEKNADAEDIECSVGEYPKNGKCVSCDQKNNPGVRWENSGKDCKISKCVSQEYELIDADKDQPQCLKKCDVWGGVASREWIRDDAEFSFCGSGKYIKCDNGFSKTNEQTSSSGTQAWHCVVEGTMTGKCKDEGKMNAGKFANGKCMQICENGYWSSCSLKKFCEKGFGEDNFRDVIVVNDKKDKTTSIFDCVSNK